LDLRKEKGLAVLKSRLKEFAGGASLAASHELKGQSEVLHSGVANSSSFSILESEHLRFSYIFQSVNN
jgi:hypothetical protein